MPRAQNGRRITWLSRHLGHSSLKVTTDVYGHFERAERKAKPSGWRGCSASSGDSPLVAVDVLYRGFSSAYTRFMESGRLATEPVDALLPLFEALNWASTLDERLAWEAGGRRRFDDRQAFDWSWRDEYPEGDVVPGFRFARNRVHHQWAEALYVDPRGAMLPALVPTPCGSGAGGRSFRLAPIRMADPNTSDCSRRCPHDSRSML